jgi:hypothetical protein
MLRKFKVPPSLEQRRDKQGSRFKVAESERKATAVTPGYGWLRVVTDKKNIFYLNNAGTAWTWWTSTGRRKCR